MMLPGPASLPAGRMLRRIRIETCGRSSWREKHANLTSFDAVRRIMRRRSSGSGGPPFAPVPSGPFPVEAWPGLLVPLKVRLRPRRARLPLLACAPGGDHSARSARPVFLFGSWRKDP